MMRTGLDRKELWKPLLAGKRVGLVTNPAALFSDYKDSIMVVREDSHLVALFGPEHGVRGSSAAGEHVEDSLDPVTHLPVYSLYGGEETHLNPKITDLVDILVYDIQDLGLRFYTYVASLKNLLLDAAKLGLPLVVLDRPNPLGSSVEGAPLSASDASFVGPEGLPIRYGLTAGELALWFNTRQEKPAKLTVVPMEGWTRDMLWPECRRLWAPTSPAIASFESAFCYSGFCLLEGTSISEGRGTASPFQLFGSPTLDNVALASYLNGLHLDGLSFGTRWFVPTSSKWKDEECRGVFVYPYDVRTASPLSAAIHAISWMAENDNGFLILPPRKEGAPRPLSRLAGKEYGERMLASPEEVLSEWKEKSRQFLNEGKKGWIYGL